MVSRPDVPALRGPADVVEPDLGQALTAAIRLGDMLAPRSLQTHLGPSELGIACERRLGYAWLGTPAVNMRSDPIAAGIGTGTGMWLDGIFGRVNAALGRERWLMQQRVTLRPGLSGDYDLYDVDTDTLIDIKVPGKTNYDKYRKGQMREQYRVQVHLYGLGCENAGRAPKTVAIAVLSRSAARLKDLYLWSEPFDRNVALAALSRLDSIAHAVTELDVETHPERWSEIPETTGHECMYCDYHNPAVTEASDRGCPGDPNALQLSGSTASLQALIAPTRSTAA